MSRAELLAENRQLWDAWTQVHAGSRFYDVDGFRAGASSLNPIELAEVGDVAGKTLLHLQCHFGLDTLSWARLGARATGVDFSAEAIELARRLAEELALPARFLCSDVYELPQCLDERFDIVFTSYGVVEWLPDLATWARLVASYLRPGGVFHLVELHPILGTLGEDGTTPVHPYFSSPEPIRTVESGTYADPDAAVEGVSYAWAYSLGEIVTAVVAAGLELEFLHEFPDSPYDCYPFTEEVEPGRAVIPGREGKIPLVFSLKATKP